MRGIVRLQVRYEDVFGRRQYQMLAELEGWVVDLVIFFSNLRM